MNTFIAIAGSPTAGITVLRKDGGICRLDLANTAALGWTAAASTTRTLTPYAALSTSGASTMTTLAVQDAFEYLTTFNPMAEWKKIDPILPPTLKIAGVAGDHVGGYMVLDGTGKPHHVDADTRDWKALAAPLPFQAQQAALIAGDGTNGFILVSTDEVSAVARSMADFRGWTLLTSPAPIKIDLIAGDFKNGFVAYGEGQLYALNAGKESAVWTKLTTPDFHFVALAGNATDGIAALVNANVPETEANLVVYCTNPSKDSWVLALVADNDSKLPSPESAPSSAPASAPAAAAT